MGTQISKGVSGMERQEGKKYYISSKTNFWVGCSFVTILIAYAILTYFINSDALESADPAAASYTPFITAVRDVTLVILSVLGTCWLTSWIIDVRARNEMYSDHFSNDFLSDPDIYLNMTEATQKKMLSSMENALLFNGKPHLSSMYDNIKEKFITLSRDDYYYDDCRYTIDCDIMEDRIVKSITRTLKVKSYDAQCTVKDFPLVTWSGRRIKDKGGKKVVPFKYTSVTLDGKTIPKYDIKSISEPSNNIASLNSGYSVKYTYRYAPELALTDNQPRIFSVTYTTIVPLDDIVYTCRANVPCRNFSVDFRVSSCDDRPCKAMARAFGFFDSAMHSPIIEENGRVRVSFNDWIFPHDGIVITSAVKSEGQ